MSLCGADGSVEAARWSIEGCDVPLATTLASALKSTTKIFPMCPAILRIVVPVMTSHRNTERSPPEDANFALS